MLSWQQTQGTTIVHIARSVRQVPLFTKYCYVLTSIVHTTSGASSASSRRVCTVSVATRSRNASAETVGAGGSAATSSRETSGVRFTRLGARVIYKFCGRRCPEAHQRVDPDREGERVYSSPLEACLGGAFGGRVTADGLLLPSENALVESAVCSVRLGHKVACLGRNHPRGSDQLL